jgi:predicted glycosyltransferase
MKREVSGSVQKKIWIDLDNTPHVPFFKPIIEELNKRDYFIILTARDCFQVCELADLLSLPYKRIGRHYGKNKILKAIGTLFRAVQLMSVILREKPDLAISHGSRSQLVASAILNIPSIMITDYEYSHFFPIIKPRWLILPEVISDKLIKISKERILKYPGIKEDVYVPNVKPNPSIKDELGINEELIVTIRPPATEAHYHLPESEELFYAAMDFLINQKNISIILLPRNEKQAELIRKLYPEIFDKGKIIIPDHAVDGLNLIWHSDLVISGGGTMNREAAALGVPVYSIFRGKIGAVDQYLSETGRLTLLKSVEDVRTKIALNRRQKDAKPAHRNMNTLKSIVEGIEKITESI